MGKLIVVVGVERNRNIVLCARGTFLVAWMSLIRSELRHSYITASYMGLTLEIALFDAWVFCLLVMCNS